MTDYKFVKVTKRRVAKILDVLASKGKEYGRVDRLFQFKEAALRDHCTPEKSLRGMAIKHDISVTCIVEDIDKNDSGITRKFIDEKIGDAINYLILLEALLVERYDFSDDEEKDESGQADGSERSAGRSERNGQE